jgi:hypothetical protein
MLVHLGSDPGLTTALTGRPSSKDMLQICYIPPQRGPVVLSGQLDCSFLLGNLEAPPGFEPGMEVLQTPS